MKNYRKVLIFVTFILGLFIVAQGAYAENKLWLTNATGVPGGQVTVEAHVTLDQNLQVMGWTITFDPNALTLQNCTVLYNTDVSPLPDEVSTAADGTHKVVYQDFTDLVALSTTAEDRPLIRYTFKIADGVTIGDYPITISWTEGNEPIDDKGNDVSGNFTLESGKITILAPGISVTPSFHNFGPVPVGDSKTQSFTIINTGNEALNIGSIALDGVNAAEFFIQNDKCSNQTVAQGGNCTFEVVFKPTTVGTNKAADISIPTNAPGSPTTVPLDGIGAGFGATNSSVSISGVPYSVDCNGTINSGEPIVVSEDNLKLTITVKSDEIPEGYNKTHQIGAVIVDDIVDDSDQIPWTKPDKNENDLAGKNIRYLKAILDNVQVKKENGEVSVTIPKGAHVYYKARTAGGTWISGSLQNFQQNGPVTTQGNTVTFDPSNLIQKVRNAVQKNRPDVDFCEVPGGDVVLSGTYKFWLLTNVPLACYKNGTPEPFTSTGSLTNVYGQNLTNATMLYGKVKLTADAIKNLFCPREGGGPSGGGGAAGGGGASVNSGGTVPPYTTATVPAGSTISNVTNEGTIKNSGTIQNSKNKGTIEGGTVAGTIENEGTLKDVKVAEDAVVQGGKIEGTIENKGVIKDVTIAENTVVKGGNLEGTITIGKGAKLENVKVAADAEVNISGTDVEVSVVTESGSKLVLQPGASIHGVVSSAEGAKLSIPEGAIEVTTDSPVVIQFSKPEIPIARFSSFAALSIPPLPEQYTLVDALTVCPDGYKLSKPATLVIPYDGEKIPADLTNQDLKVLVLDPDTVQWQEVTVNEATDNKVTFDTDILSTYAVVAQSELYPVISTVVGSVVNPESISTPIENALKEILPDIAVTVKPDKSSGILAVNIAGTEYPIVVTSTGTASQAPDKVKFEVLKGGLCARFVLRDGTTIEIAPMAADPGGIKDAFTNAGLTTEFQPDKGMIIVTDTSHNRYAGIFGWSAGPFGTKTIDTFTTLDGCVQIVYKDGSLQSVAPAVGSPEGLLDLLNDVGVQYTIDRSTGVINLTNGSSCWKPDYTIRPFAGSELGEYKENRDAHGIYFKGVVDGNGDGLVDVEMWTEIGKQVIWQVLCE